MKSKKFSATEMKRMRHAEHRRDRESNEILSSFWLPVQKLSLGSVIRHGKNE
jgi:hypothetical protein